MKLFWILALFLLTCYTTKAQLNRPVVVSQPYIFNKFIRVHDSVQAPIYFQGTDTLATNALVRQRYDSIYLKGGDTLYLHKTGSTQTIVIPVLSNTQITQIAESFSAARFDTTARALWLYDNDGDSVSVIIPGGSGGGGSGITAQTSSKTLANMVTLTANTSAFVAFSVHDTFFVYPDTIIWNGKMDSVRVNSLLSSKVNVSDTATMLSTYAKLFQVLKYSDTMSLISTQGTMRRVVDSGLANIPYVSSVNGIAPPGPGPGALSLTTTNLPEGTNQYSTSARIRAALSGSAPLLYNSTTGVFSLDTSTQTTGSMTTGNGRRISDSAAAAFAAAAVAALTTSVVPEGTNQYFTQARARTAIGAAQPITYNSSTGVTGVDTATQITGLSTISGARRLADSAAAAAVGLPYTSLSPILISSRQISADTATQASGLATIANARRIADSAAAAAAGGTYVSPTSSTGNIVFTGNGQVKGTALTIDLKPNLIVADTTVDSASLHSLIGANGVSVANGTKVMLSASDVTVGVSPGGLDSSRFAQSPTAIIKATVTTAAPVTYNLPSAQIGVDTSTNVSGLLTRANGRNIADSAAAAAVGAPYTGNAPISVTSKAISIDTSSNVRGVLTRADGRRIADSAAAAAGGGIAGYNVQWIYGGHVNIPAKGGDSLYINTNLQGKHINVTMFNGYASTRLVDSATWAYEGSNPNQLYFKFKTNSDTVTFCNTSNVQSLVNGTEFDIQAGGQGFPMNLDTGGAILGPPIVNAGSNQTIVSPASTATLTGSATPTIPGGSIASYLWTIVSEPSGAAATITSPSLSSTTVTNMANIGNYVYQLTATDNVGNSGSAQTTVTVSNQQIAKFNFSSSAAPVTGYTNVYGNPHQTGGITFTDATTSWQISSAGLTANWQNFSSFFGNNTIGVSGGSTDGAFSQAAMNNNIFNYNLQYSSGNYGFTLSNLPAGTYSIEFIGSSPSGSFNNNGPMQVHVQFGSGSDNYASFDPTVSTGTGGNLTPIGPGTTNVTSGSFNGMITAGQTIKIGVYAGPTNVGQAGFINAMIITKTS